MPRAPHSARDRSAVSGRGPEPAGDPAEADAAASWRDVSPSTYRRATFISSIVGVALMATGMWDLAHAHLARGVALVGVGFAVGVWTALLRIDGMPAPLHRPTGSGPAGAPGPRRHARTTLEAWSPQVLHFYTRENCSICHEARLRVDHDLGGAPVTVVERDVDADGALQQMYGDRVPVAVFDGKEVFALQYDAAAVRAVAAAARGGDDAA